MLAELEATVDALRERDWRPSDAVIADTIYTLGDAIAEVDRILLDLHKELVRSQSETAPGRGGSSGGRARPRRPST